MALPLLILAILLPIILLLIFKTNNRKLNLPPSPPKLPIIGNLHQLGSLPHRSLRSLSLKHGPLMLLHLGQTPTLVISSAEIVKEIVKTHDITFANRPQTTAANIILYGCSDMSFAPYGEFWRQQRKLVLTELLSIKRVQSFQYVRDEEVENLLVKIGEDRIRQGFVDLTEMLCGVVNKVVSRCVLGSRVVGASKFGELTRKVNIHLAEICVGDFFPWLGWVDVVGGRVGRIKETFDAFDSLFDEVIEEHRRGSRTHDDKKDFVDILLQLQMNTKLDDKELTQNHIKAILMDIFVAGTDTGSTTIEWTMTELIRNQDKMKKVQKEIRTFVENKGQSKIEISDIKEMEYLKCVIKEILRLHPPAPFFLPRVNSASVRLCGYDIPKKATVSINSWAIHTDPKNWDRPEEFIPERFMNNPIDFKGDDFHYLPFGIGRRFCPGMTFGLSVVEYVLANLLYLFDWKLFGSDEVDMSEDFGITLAKKLPLLLEPTPYSP